MHAEKRDVFHRNADALAQRGAALTSRALGDAGMLRISATSTHRPRLEATLLGVDERRCVILGRAYAEGDAYVLPSDEELDGVKVRKIHDRSVELSVKGGDVVLKLD